MTAYGIESLTFGRQPVPITAPVLTISGLSSTSPTIGSELSVIASATQAATLSYLWSTGETTATILILPEYEGETLSCTVTATNAVDTVEAVSATTSAVTYEAPVVIEDIEPVLSDVSETALIIDVSPYFDVPLVDDLVGITWSATGDEASVADENLPFVTLDRSSAITTTAAVIASNSGGTASITFDFIVTGEQDTTPPVLSGAATSLTQIDYVSNESDGTFYWRIDTEDQPTPAEVVAGGGLLSGSLAVTGDAQDIEVDLSGLSGIHYLGTVHADASGNESNMVATTINIVAVDVTAPVLDVGAVAAGTTTAERSVSTDEGNGTLWWLVDGNETRTPAQVKAAGTSRPVAASGVQSPVSVSGLTAATGYDFHVMHEDLSGNQSAVDSEAFTTPAATAGAMVEQTISVVSSSADVAEYTGAITIGSESNRGVLAIVHGYNAASETVISGRTPPANVPGAVTITLDGDPMEPVKAPELILNGRGWIAGYFLTAPDTGELAFSVGVSEPLRAMEVTLVEFSGVNQTTPVVFVADTIKNAAGSTLSGPQDFPSRTMASTGNLLVASISIDSGTTDLPTERGGTMLLAGKTGPLGTSDVTFATVTRDSSGVVGFLPASNARMILTMFEIGAA